MRVVFVRRRARVRQGSRSEGECRCPCLLGFSFIGLRRERSIGCDSRRSSRSRTRNRTGMGRGTSRRAGAAELLGFGCRGRDDRGRGARAQCGGRGTSRVEVCKRYTTDKAIGRAHDSRRQQRKIRGGMTRAWGCGSGDSGCMYASQTSPWRRACRTRGRSSTARRVVQASFLAVRRRCCRVAGARVTWRTRSRTLRRCRSRAESSPN